MTKTKKRSIPKFKNIQEEAEFWDTHSLADFWDDAKPMKVRFAKNLKHVLSVRFDTKTITELQTRAIKKGVGTTTLVRMWILEYLEHEHSKQAQLDK